MTKKKNPRRVRLEGDGTWYGTRLIDDETGEIIECLGVDISIRVNKPTKVKVIAASDYEGGMEFDMVSINAEKKEKNKEKQRPR